MGPPAVVALRSLPRVHVLLDYESCVLPGVCGNKARKLAALAAAPGNGQLVSHGGPQSNAMLALARLAAARGGRLTYHTTPLPKWLRDAPSGNLASALACGMQLCEHPMRQAYAEACAAAAADAKRQAAAGGCTSWVERGGACPAAEVGIAGLAEDVACWLDEQSNATLSSHSCVVPGESRLYTGLGIGTACHSRVSQDSLYATRETFLHSPPTASTVGVPPCRPLLK
jgi:1-aminocyclopropane-1-carboxylate deaminase/D-cysteine desulfhydrase-like pyridoxal-dependent ACC family enzyme